MEIGAASMFNHHLALAFVHLAIGAILLAHGGIAEAVCVVVVAAIYAAIPPGGR